MIRRLSLLFRIPLSLMNGMAAMGGYCLFPGVWNIVDMLVASVGVTLLAMGGAALNQVLERDIDPLMTRTRERPLPRGDMTPAVAAFIAGCAGIAGCMVLFVSGGFVPVLLGLAALVWYLAVYTPLKQRTPLALPVGALCGALPPMIGWCLAGGGLTDFRIIIFSGMFYIWQIPHFWMLQKRHADDYRRAGIPLLDVRPGFFGLWLAALSVTALMLPAFGLIGRQAAHWYALFTILLFVMTRLRREKYLFSYLNLFPLLVTLTLFLKE